MKVNKKFAFVFFVAFLFLSTLIGLVIFSRDPHTKSLSEDVLGKNASKALLVVVEPTVTITRGEQEIEVSQGEIDVYAGDRVKTDNTGMGYIIFSDNSILTLDYDTEIEIVNNEEAQDSFKITIKQFAGRVWSRVVNLTGKKADYEIDTANTLAAVRGTQFSCQVDTTGTVCHTYEGTVALTLKNVTGIENEVLIGAGTFFANKNSEIKKIHSYKTLQEGVRKFEQKQDYWVNFNSCLDTKINEVMELQEDTERNYLIDRSELISCLVADKESQVDNATGDEPMEESITNTLPEATYQPIETASLPEPIVNGVTISINKNAETVTCTWNAIHADSYDVAIGSSTGSVDVTGWKGTADMRYTTSTASLISGTTYYCSVRAKNAEETSSLFSSSGQYYDMSEGTFSYPLFIPPGNNSYTGQLSGSGQYLNIPLDHLQVRFYLKNAEGKYFNGTSWGDTPKWFTVNLTTTGVSQFSFTKSMYIAPTLSMDVYYELYNQFSQTMLDTYKVKNVSVS